MQLQAGTIFRSVLGAFKDAFEDGCVMLSCWCIQEHSCHIVDFKSFLVNA